MKRTAIVVLMGLLPFLGMSQSVFDQFEDRDNVATVVINKGMINLASLIAAAGDDEAKEFSKMAKGLDGVKIFVTQDSKVSDEMESTVKSHLKNSGLEELMRVKDEDANVKIYVRNGKDENHVTELLMFASDIKETKVKGRELESVIVTMTGDIDLRDIGKLTDKMKLHEGLKNAEKE